MLETLQHAYQSYRRTFPQIPASEALQTVRSHYALANLERAGAVRFEWPYDEMYTPDGDCGIAEEEAEKLESGAWVAYGCRLQVRVTSTKYALHERLQKLGCKPLTDGADERWLDASDVLDPNGGINPPQGFHSGRGRDGQTGEIKYEFTAAIMDALWGIVVGYAEGTELGTYRREVEIDLAVSCGLVD